MTTKNTAPSVSAIEQLKSQLRESLYLDLDEYGLEEQSSGEFDSTFLGLQLNSAFQPIYDSEAGDLFGHEALSGHRLAANRASALNSPSALLGKWASW
ncbi:hypothetical protein [Methylobacillus flagellatus]|uniref:Uncharacterized protein n=1 Tax=Methylobacillus flagellatus (strain ATCC 51484 / DSM 6875 / VKM B-1610 / KT) TaxID=265072 RepID=Q1H3Q4_METFK|nr:hypothetical protein [Methylobacillus flagellatus]ABE48883.1 hypothetical protein Mfla_0613 [Methylobacillus flagellatus KT]